MLILTGTGRSGTGMLARLFGGHHEFRATWLLEKYAPPGRVPFRSLDERISAVLDLHLGVDPEGFIDASNLYIHLIDALGALYPDLRLVLAVRDGRDFVRSAVTRGWHGRRGFDTCPAPGTADFERWPAMTPVERAAWIWVRRNEIALTGLEALPEHCRRVVRIEDLEEGNLDGLARFAGVPIRDAGAVSRRVNANPEQSLPPFGRWPEEDRRAFERIAGGMMRRLGYGGVRAAAGAGREV